MNNKGFTLIELIATIALLAIIATISFVAISGVVQSSKKRDCETLVGNIESEIMLVIIDMIRVLLMG